LARIFKSSTVLMDTDKPIVLEFPGGIPGLRDRVARAYGSGDSEDSLLPDSTMHALMERAKAGASTLLEQAKTEAEALRTKAVEEGLSAGEKKKKAECDAQLKKQAAQHAARMAALEKENQAQMDALEPEILELSLAIAEKILHIELSRNDKAFAGLVRGALVRLKSGERGTIRIGRDDFFRSIHADDELLATAQMDHEFITDDNLPPGSCIVKSDSGTVDFGADVQLANIASELRCREPRGGKA
jgi:flagellar biosynthesis/type III secretory pathway protein FliH